MHVGMKNYFQKKNMYKNTVTHHVYDLHEHKAETKL